MTTPTYFKDFLQVGDKVRLVNQGDLEGVVKAKNNLALVATVMVNGKYLKLYLDEYEPVEYRGTPLGPTTITLYGCPSGHTIGYIPMETMLPAHCMDCGSELVPLEYVPVTEELKVLLAAAREIESMRSPSVAQILKSRDFHYESQRVQRLQDAYKAYERSINAEK